MTTTLLHALGRIRDATPDNTNSSTAESMASWTHAVAATAIAGNPLAEILAKIGDPSRKLNPSIAMVVAQRTPADPNERPGDFVMRIVAAYLRMEFEIARDIAISAIMTESATEDRKAWAATDGKVASEHGGKSEALRNRAEELCDAADALLRSPPTS
jgi:hypothetical protein